VNKLLFLCLGVLLLSVAAYANTTPSAFCTPNPVNFASGVGGPTAVSCPAFSIAGATLTGVTLSYEADFILGTTATNTVAVVFTPTSPGGVTWTASSVTLDPTGSSSSNTPAPTGSSSATAGVSSAAFASAFNVNVSSSIVTGGVDESAGIVSVVYTYTPAPPPALACPASTGMVGTPYSSALVASSGVPPYGPYAITSGSISPLTLNTATGAITGTPTTAGTLTFMAMVTDSIGGTATTGATACTITISNIPPPPTGPCNPTTPVFSMSEPAGVFQVRYAANLNVGDSFVDVTNDGAQGNAANICVNVYTFDPAEELISCCACLVTPDGLQSISVLNSLISNPLTPAVPTAVVVKLVASVPGTGALAGGMLAWGTTLHAKPTSPVSYGVTESPFSQADLSSGELSHLKTTCGFIQANGSGFGICKGCSSGGLGSSTSSQ